MRLGRALELLSGQLACERIFFLGGRYSDLDAVLKQRTPKREAQDTGEVFVAEVARFVAARELEREGTGLALGAEELFGVPVVRVPEQGSARYDDSDTPNVVLEMLGATIVLLVHNKADLVRDQIANAQLIAHGNSPEAAVVQIGPRAFVTPGSLQGDGASIGVVDDTGGAPRFDVHDLQGVLTQSHALSLRRASRLIVR